MAWLMILLIRFYQKFVSPRLPAMCNLTPSCSQYGLEAIRKYGFFQGCRLIEQRLVRCAGGTQQLSFIATLRSYLSTAVMLARCLAIRRQSTNRTTTTKRKLRKDPVP